MNRQNLPNQLTAGEPLSRREVLGTVPRAALVFALTQLLGCGRKEAAPVPATPEKPQPTFEQLTDFVRAKFGPAVKEVKKLGPTTIVYLGDVHSKLNAEKLIGRIQTIEEFFDLQIVGTEGIVEHPESEVDKKAHKDVDAILAIDPKKTLQIQGGGTPIISSPQGSFSPLYSNASFTGIGLESPEFIKLVGLGATAEEIIDTLMQIIEQGYYPVAKGDKTAAMILEYLQIQAALKDEPLFPKLDLKKIQYQKDGVTIIGKEDNALVGEMAVKFSQWRDTRLVATRNAIAVEKLTSAMQARGLTRGAMTFGRAHARKSPFDPTGLTIQEELAKRNVSYIYIDIE